VRLKVRQGYDAGGRLGSDGMDADTILSEDERILRKENLFLFLNLKKILFRLYK